MFRRIIYSSTAASDVGVREAYSIIRVSHNRNSQAGLTGGLILLDGHFFQLLEGLPSAVDDRFQRIEADSRHYDIVIRGDEISDAPLFESDWMALRDASQISADVLAAHNYQIGMPADQFANEQVLAFMLACFDKEPTECVV